MPDRPGTPALQPIPIPRENLHFEYDANAPAVSSIAFLVIMLEPEAPGEKCQWSFTMRNYTTDMWHSQVLYVSPGTGPGPEPKPELSVDVHYHDPTQLPNYVEMIVFKERIIPHRTAARIIDACMAVKIPDCGHRECPSADYVLDVVAELERLGAIDLFDMHGLLTQTAKFGINPLESDEEVVEGGQ
ncbi:hypothetical protein BHE90_010018 [Fusarium euwallaceae]|uniref:Uncharacterized protein n=4 Tax=Fusarium solani species complex TaxID=232080 RepID=A0A3M2RHH9_9HYPO|nr:hypothetical protein CDV36_014546 [Fusarium kuroshium]RSL78904.1 hypothetical protein CEP51_007808 [Fusarium floridanum]RSM00850.1 hypothetical protein CDV31_011603 [Fusarium ambrosium]RTE75536.1 hypothetical protein BHE90_010018 [Fusarium euwallaceae]